MRVIPWLGFLAFLACGELRPVLSPPPMHPYYAEQLRTPSVKAESPAPRAAREAPPKGLVIEEGGMRYHYRLDHVEPAHADP